MVSSGRALAPLSEMCLTLQHLSGLDRNNPQPNSGGCHLEICAGKESVSAYSNKPHLQPHLSHQNSLSPFLLPTALNTSSIAEMLGKSKEGKKLKWMDGSCQVPFNSLSDPYPELTLLQAGAAPVMSGPIADIHSNIPQHLAVASPPTIKSLPAPDAGADLCALAPLPAHVPLSHPDLTDRQD